MSYFPPFADNQRGPGYELIIGSKSLQTYQSPQIGPTGLSAFREYVSETGSASITINNETEYQLSTTASGSDECEMETTDVCRFYPGQLAEVGLAVRSPDAFTGNQEVTFGIDDAENGVGFGRNATGWFVWVRNGGSITRVQSSSWNVDEMTGLGPSGLDIDGTTTTRFVVEFSSTFLGLINFYVIAWNTTTEEQVKVLVHRWAPVSGALESSPYGPIRVHLDNAATATARDFFVSELWFATGGSKVPEKVTREIFAFRLNMTPSTTVIPAVFFRKKTGARNQRSRVFLTGFEYIITGADLIITVRYSPTTLTGASWTTTQVLATETSLEADVSATAVSGGDNRAQGFFGAGSGVKDFAYPVPLGKYSDTIGVAMRTISGTASRVDIFTRAVEEW
jgi:hypothetical protein